MSHKQKVRIGMIGYKFMGKAHSHAYRDLPFYFDLGIEPVLQTMVGRDKTSVKLASEKFGWLSYETDWRRLIEREDIDVIDIGTPNNTHVEIAIAAAEAGKHIICEKPLALNTQQALNMLKAVQKAGVIHMVSYNYRFVPAIQYAKKLIQDGMLGEIYHFRAQYLQDWIMDPGFPLVWRLRKDVCGSGSLGDLMAHSIDLARFLVGEIKEVTGMMETFIKKRPLGEMSGGLSASISGESFADVDVDDAVAAMARFENGAVGVFEATRFGKGNRNGNRLEINGSKGSIRWDMESMNTLQLYLEEDTPGMQGFRSINCTESVHPYGEAYWPAGHIIGYEHTFINLMHDFMKGILTNTNPNPNFEDGYRNQVILDAIEKSASAGKWMKIKY
ncbi:Gfo/Idh/MocA family oxidoreductase [Paenibacillus sp. WQ 127069]|uniref:Gfo/Idh/MocA family oxidoreductase n=1 Tax=Paenibacillus baimaensis TaxID=2982185 RepID=A0ABT2UEI2_9BACL|nr:Gfo/Idh/MocA family oxidoreductase [Paenibacillus sp. WQ 127069]MCU6793053.1 Gfo/Idh/MocA family oxidoreductase [Paenibacillus sp. WQ 127069]